MKKAKIKKIRIAYKISIIAAALALILNFVVFFAVILPVYDVVGETSPEYSIQSDKVDNAEKTSNISTGLTILLTIVSLSAGFYGVYQDVKTKPKK